MFKISKIQFSKQIKEAEKKNIFIISKNHNRIFHTELIIPYKLSISFQEINSIS